MRHFMKETELAKPIIKWLSDQNWDIYQEVQFGSYGGVADIVAVRNGIVWIIETKVSFTLAVLQQATEWAVHYRSVGVPYARERDFRVAKFYYQVGVIEVETIKQFAPGLPANYFNVNEIVPAPLQRKNHEHSKRLLSLLTELHKTYAEAGSQSGHHLTPYKQTMIDIKKYVEKKPGCTVSDLYNDLGEMHYANINSFKGNIIKCLAQFERDWCRVDTTAKPYRLYISEKEPIEKVTP